MQRLQAEIQAPPSMAVMAAVVAQHVLPAINVTDVQFETELPPGDRHMLACVHAQLDIALALLSGAPVNQLPGVVVVVTGQRLVFQISSIYYHPEDGQPMVGCTAEVTADNENQELAGKTVALAFVLENGEWQLGQDRDSTPLVVTCDADEAVDWEFIFQLLLEPMVTADMLQTLYNDVDAGMAACRENGGRHDTRTVLHRGGAPVLQANIYYQMGGAHTVDVYPTLTSGRHVEFSEKEWQGILDRLGEHVRSQGGIMHSGLG